MIIDAKDAILGRLSTYAAKQVLLGGKVDVINCEECVISGKRHSTLREYIHRLSRKAPTKGPYFYRRPDMFVKRTIRGMLPHKRTRGRDAFQNIKCHIGVPEELKNEKAQSIESSSVEGLRADYLKVKDVCKAVGWKEQ
ncbi:50S ribosomal protein L13 [Candidatus Woesearchaeota archaeon]|jgi:large subunit ribosomal protein L13|nr:50S ribosomal protein L13 [Candidatus Woesearchaeota archaeon]MDP6648155.1 50S ribosomal protein L13 [Candidatus Woesearchaeota archaeon]|tara:strand:+ start:103181 stop:103597 length:417 start_codon:yes stop_codon:yes gene_type:complete